MSEEGEEPGMGSARTAVGVHDVALLLASDGMAPEAKAVRLPVTSGAVGLRAPIPCLAGMRVCKSQDLRHPVFGLAGGAGAWRTNKKIECSGGRPPGLAVVAHRSFRRHR